MSIDIIESQPLEIALPSPAQQFLIVAAETGNFLVLETVPTPQVEIQNEDSKEVLVNADLDPYVEIFSCGDISLPLIDYLDISSRDSTNPLLVYGGRTNDLSLDPSLPVWQIYVFNIDTLEKKYANSDTTYTHIWDNRESLTYG